jgi:hypothetical protein
LHIDPYRTPPAAQSPVRVPRPWDPTWLPLAIVLSLPLTLVLFCAMIRSSIDAELVPSTVLHGAIGYAVLVLFVCGRDLPRSR